MNKLRASASRVSCCCNKKITKSLPSQKEILFTVRGYASPGDKSGSIGEAGGVFKDMGTAREAQFFHKKERELLKNLKNEMKEQIEFHEEQIAIHQAVIKKLRKRQKDMGSK